MLQLLAGQTTDIRISDHNFTYIVFFFFVLIPVHDLQVKRYERERGGSPTTGRQSQSHSEVSFNKHDFLFRDLELFENTKKMRCSLNSAV